MEKGNRKGEEGGEADGVWDVLLSPPADADGPNAHTAKLSQSTAR